MQARNWLVALGLAAAFAPPAMAQMSPAAFTGGTAGDLATLCSASDRDPMHPAALAWCRGFLVSAAQYHATMAAEGGAHRPIFCLPQPEPTVDQARLAYVDWVRAHPQHSADRAVDGVIRFAAATYPCPPAAPTRPRR